jgi:hypothetical protein
MDIFVIKTAILRWNSSGITVIGIDGRAGDNNDQLNAPWNMVLDWSHTLYITDHRRRAL